MNRFFIPLLGIAIPTAVMAAERDTVSLDNVVVTGTRGMADVRHLPMTVSVIDRSSLTEYNRQSILPTAMEQTPGLLVLSRGVMGYGVSTGAAGGMTLRGASSSSGQMMVLIDGHPQYNGIYGHSIADSYLTHIAEKVEVMRGPASLLYGSNAMGGVMNIVTRKVTADGLTGSMSAAGGSYGSAQADGALQYRSNKFATTLAGQYSRSDNHRRNMPFEQYGGLFKMSYDICKHWDASVALDVTHFNASNPGTVASPMIENDQWITRASANLVIANHFERTSGALSVYDNCGWHKINDGYALNGGTPQTDLFRSRDAVAGVSYYQTATFFERNPLTMTFGIDYQHIYGRAWYTDRVTGETVTTKKRLMQSTHIHDNDVAEYLQFRQELGRCVTLDFGIRLDWHSTAGTQCAPQAGIAVRPSANTTLKGMVSRGFRNPTTREMYLYGTANHDSLRAESMMNYEISWRHSLCEGAFTYGINLFYIDAANMIQTVAGRNINTGAFHNSGAELDATILISDKWRITTNHSYLHMNKPIVASPQYKGYAGVRYTGGRLSASVGVQQLCGMYTVVGAKEEKENVTLLSATASYAFTPALSFFARGENLLCQTYEFNAGYPMPRATFMAGATFRF